MKIRIALIALLSITYVTLCGAGPVTERSSSKGDSTKVFSTPDLFSLTSRWVEEFNKVHTEGKIKLIEVSDSKTGSILLVKGEIGIISNEYVSGLGSESVWKSVIGRDVIVPVINAKNPFLKEISQNGVSAAVLKNIISNTDSQTWGAFVKSGDNTKVKYIWVNEESVRNGVTAFVGAAINNPSGIEVRTGKELIAAIQKDPLAIGFCKMVDLADNKSESLAENVSLLPIDRNSNGIIDSNEKIYDDLNVFARGVWIGKYPKALVSNIFSVSSRQPGNATEIAFIKWILTDGQQFLYNNGYSELLVTERQATVDKLYNTRIYSGADIEDKSVMRTALFILAFIVLAVIIADALAGYMKRRKVSVPIAEGATQPVLDENTILIPKGIYFDKTHTWAYLEQDGVVSVGIDDFLQHITGPLTRIQMKNPGDLIKKEEMLLTVIQNGKQLNLYAPISGIIKERNKALDSNSSLINSSPYNDGWIYKIEPTNWGRENQLLFMAEKQRQYIKNEFSRLKDFLAATINRDNEKYMKVVLQDGGELRDGSLSNLGPEVWDDFQTKFIDPARQLWFYEIF
jgi:glycine cleavage system H lipoate-binding protein/ABC-type phosphate transport system substrate-binding protein